MFIYEKRLIDKSTGQANDTLNITFEGNKPVETPDVIINKDGVIGIKSDAYIAINALTSEYSAMTISSISADGEIVNNIDIGEPTGLASAPILFKHTIGINITHYNTETSTSIFSIIDKQGSVTDILPTESSGFDTSNIQIGEYIFDIENRKIDMPMGTYNFESNILDNIYCVRIGQAH